jgi:hypothetical protein
MDLTSVFTPVINLLSNHSTAEASKDSLRKLFLLECRTNQKLLSIANWSKVSSGIRNEALRNLSSENAKAYYAVSDKDMLGKLLEKLKTVITKESNEEKMHDSNKITSLITRTDALKFLGGLSSELQEESKAKYSVRIKNLDSIIAEVILIPAVRDL